VSIFFSLPGIELEQTPLPQPSSVVANVPPGTGEGSRALDQPGAPAPKPVGDHRPGLILAVTALALALIGEFYFKTFKYVLDGVVFFGAAVIVFLASVRGNEASVQSETSPTIFQRMLDSVRRNPLRSALVILSIALAYTGIRTLQMKAGNVQYWDVFWMWVASFLSYAAAFVRIPRPHPRAWWRTYRLEVWLVLGLTIVAAALRFVRLGEIPNIISGDEGRVGVLAQSVLNGELNNMMATVFGNSTLYLYLVAAIIKWVGVADAMTLRVTAALAGTLTVPAVYVFARRFFNLRVALVAACLLTVSHIHLHFSRIVVAGGIQDALFATVAFYFFLSGLENRSATRLTLSGLIMGLHIYIYMGARLVILFMPFYVLALLITNPKLVRENLGNLLIFAGMLIVVAAPMGLWAIQHPDDFNARANQIGVIQSGWLAQEAIKLNQSQLRILLTLLGQAILTVNYYPAIAFYNATLPMLDFFTGAVFVLGLAYSLSHATDRRHLLLNGWFWSAIVVGGALVVLPATSAYRILIMFPAVCIFVGLAWDRLVELGFRSFAFPALGTGIATAACILVFTVFNLRAYFVDYGPSCRYEDWNTRFASYMGESLGQAGPGYKAYLLGYPRIWYGIHPSVDYLSGKIPISDIKQPLTGPTTLQSQNGRVIFFFTPEREREMDWVKQSVPGGEVRRIYDCGNLMLTIYQVGGVPDK
jgi:hypothetical protein